MAVNIVTGHTGQTHITSDDERVKNAEAFGTGKFVLNEGGRLWATKVDNTTVRISSGMCMSYGTQMGIEPYDSTDVTLDPGATGYQRYDIIAMRYHKDDDVETASLVVHKGEPAQQNPAKPTDKLVTGNILEGADTDDTPLWLIKFNGTNIEEITSDNALFKLRSGYVPSNPDDPDPSLQPDPDSDYVITAATVDKLWGEAFEDIDATAF